MVIQNFETKGIKRHVINEMIQEISEKRANIFIHIFSELKQIMKKKMMIKSIKWLFEFMIKMITGSYHLKICKGPIINSTLPICFKAFIKENRLIKFFKIRIEKFNDF